MPTKTTTKKSTFDVLNAVNVNDRTEKKGHLLICLGRGRGKRLRKLFQTPPIHITETKKPICHSPTRRGWVLFVIHL